jgi:hypothetical protein
MDVFPKDVVFDSGSADTRSFSSLDKPEFTLLPAIEECVGLSLMCAQVPFTYWVIDNTNNKFTITINTYSTNTAYNGNQYEVTIFPGSYSKTSIIGMISYCCQSNTVKKVGATGTNSDLISVFSLDFLIDNSTGQFSIYSSNSTVAAAVTFTISFPINLSGSIGSYLGFLNVSSANSSSGSLLNNSDQVVTTGHHITSPGAINLSGPSYLFLHSEKLSGVIPG